MKENLKQIRMWHIFGFFLIVGLGSLLHFTFEWSGDLVFVGLFSAVNESVWEHFKLSYFALLFFSLIEVGFLYSKTKNYFLAKALAIYAMNAFILMTFYTYEGVLGNEILIIDILLFVVGAGLAQWVSYKVMTCMWSLEKWKMAGILLLLLHGIVLVVFTFSPPNLPLFEEGETGQFGIDLKR